MGRVTLHVADAAVASVAAAAATTVPGVVLLRADVTPDPESLVRVRIATRMSDNCRDVAVAVQRTVTHVLAEQTGRTARVEVTVAEILI